MPSGAFFNSKSNVSLGGLTDPEVVLLLGTVTDEELDSVFVLFNASSQWVSASEIDPASYIPRRSRVKPPSLAAFIPPGLKLRMSPQARPKPLANVEPLPPETKPAAKPAAQARPAATAKSPTPAKSPAGAKHATGAKAATGSKAGAGAKPAAAAKPAAGAKPTTTAAKAASGGKAAAGAKAVGAKPAAKQTANSGGYDIVVKFEVPEKVRRELGLDPEHIRHLFGLLAEAASRGDAKTRKITTPKLTFLASLEDRSLTSDGSIERLSFRLTIKPKGG